MFPWMQDAITLSLACRALRLAPSKKGTWRPTASPEDINTAFANIAAVLQNSHVTCVDQTKYMEEAERLRLCVIGLLKLAINSGLPKEQVAHILETVMTEDISLKDDSDVLAWNLIPLWARRRARRRVEKVKHDRGMICLDDVPVPPLANL